MAATLLVFSGWVIYAIFNSSSFFVYDIQVRGNAAVTSEEVYSTTDLEGLSVFWVDPAAVARARGMIPALRHDRSFDLAETGALARAVGED